jgi:hypothetical protein
MPDLLLGTTRSYNSSTSPVSYLRASKFTASKSGILTEFHIECHGSGDVKLAVYADNAGSVGTRLWVQNTGQAVAAGWNTIAVSSGPSIVTGNAYWKASNNGTANILRYDIFSR